MSALKKFKSINKKLNIPLQVLWGKNGRVGKKFKPLKNESLDLENIDLYFNDSTLKKIEKLFVIYLTMIMI